MGSLMYRSRDMEVSFDDRALMHLQIVITAKLRRGESFIFSWTSALEASSSRSSIWLDPSSILLYRFSGSRTPAINSRWIETLMLSANSPGGLFFTVEPASPSGQALFAQEMKPST